MRFKDQLSELVMEWENGLEKNQRVNQKKVSLAYFYYSSSVAAKNPLFLKEPSLILVILVFFLSGASLLKNVSRFY